MTDKEEGGGIHKPRVLSKPERGNVIDMDFVSELHKQRHGGVTMANGFILPEGRTTPNTLFVGGIDMKVEENEIRDFFARYGAVKEVKIITYRGGICKGYGFVYFSEDVDIQTIVEQQITFKGKKLKLGPAIMKERSSRESGFQGSVQSPLIHPSQWVSPCVYCTCCSPSLVTPTVLSGDAQYLQPYSYPSFPGVMIPQMPVNYTQAAYAYPYSLPQWCGDQRTRFMNQDGSKVFQVVQSVIAVDDVIEVRCCIGGVRVENPAHKPLECRGSSK
ncbi:deleted in azoospermia-like [Neoarius graeffei]|uniref:deleted in azoospermia-like n=1 Tax=Neoarius graeffei TaxID=443677 RepID=UPI00298C645B|nr:deleted in azoospermia-like [Neoarius graeffei]